MLDSSTFSTYNPSKCCEVDLLSWIITRQCQCQPAKGKTNLKKKSAKTMSNTTTANLGYSWIFCMFSSTTHPIACLGKPVPWIILCNLLHGVHFDSFYTLLWLPNHSSRLKLDGYLHVFSFVPENRGDLLAPFGSPRVPLGPLKMIYGHHGESMVTMVTCLSANIRDVHSKSGFNNPTKRRFPNIVWNAICIHL